MRYLLGIVLVLFSLSALAERTLTFLVGMDKPPYIQLQDGTGFELELLRQVSKKMGYEAVFLHVPNARIRYLLEQGHGDVATLQRLTEHPTELFYSQPYVRYQNAVITLRERELVIQHAQDMQRLNVVAFQNAKIVLGDEFGEMAQSSSRYQETTNQKTQVDMLLAGRIDAAVMDINIFHYFRRVSDDSQPIQLHTLFPPSDYRAAFREQELQLSFDRALQQLIAKPAYPRMQLEFFGSVNQYQPGVVNIQ
ncbi:transporter substrate-binding domain-containing protein [Alkalimonas sp.]|uniref:substrate-binding periplasmic protein n=1 Tax=Alkalimonas sp. TaxID=1872453 RepID=UPI00263A6217|nr:transporter substrate-binding domain-containing protein [Alkalimonas sp.]MCC5826712.1 transporter substrate-binding domain-containing protein [Alkalimonas sp.]